MIIYIIIAIGVLLRITSHVTGFDVFPPNFAPIGALALFSGVYLTGKRAYFVSLAALFLSDIVIGFYHPTVMISVYASFALITLIGTRLKEKTQHVIGGALIGSVAFFVITNFAVWAQPAAFYPHTMSGLLAAYTAGIPFFKYTIAGDLFFNGLFFGSYALAQKIAIILRSRRAGVNLA